jgi:predicted nucleic acid-binding protein
MNYETKLMVARVVLAFAPLLLTLFPARALWREWQRHKRFEAAQRDCDLAILMMRRSQTVEEVNRRHARVEECLETMEMVIKEGRR